MDGWMDGWMKGRKGSGETNGPTDGEDVGESGWGWMDGGREGGMEGGRGTTDNDFKFGFSRCRLMCYSLCILVQEWAFLDLNFHHVLGGLVTW